MFNRYNNIPKISNTSDLYSDLLKDKNLKNLLQYKTFNFGQLMEINASNVEYVLHKVQPYDKLYNISNQYYKSPEFAWLILYTNNMSSELELRESMTLRIYYPLQTLLGMLQDVK